MDDLFAGLSSNHPLLHLVVLDQLIRSQGLPECVKSDIAHTGAAVRHFAGAVAPQGVVVGLKTVG